MFFRYTKIMKNLFVKILMYVSSFIPLYFLIVIKELIDIINDNLSFNITNSVMIGFNFLLIFLGALGVRGAFFDKKIQKVSVKEFKNVTRENFLPYFPLFVLFALAFELEYISMAVVYVLILVMVGIVYIKNELFYINPFLNIIGFDIYEVIVTRDGEKEKRFLYSNKRLSSRVYYVNSYFVKI